MDVAPTLSVDTTAQPMAHSLLQLINLILARVHAYSLGTAIPASSNATQLDIRRDRV